MLFVCNPFLLFFAVDPCHNKACRGSEECVRKTRSRFECKCPTCHPSYAFVCDSDGRTYASLCQMKRFSCLNKENITLKTEKACGTYTRYSILLHLLLYVKSVEYLNIFLHKEAMGTVI